MQWQIIDSQISEPSAIMEKDAFLLEKLKPEDSPIIHFYQWSVPCLTYGYFTDPSRFLNLEALRNNGILLARRPTGGGIIFHLTDFAFSVLIPAGHPSFSVNTLENYAFINRRVAIAIAAFSPNFSSPDLLPCLKKEKIPFCMANPTQYDLMIEGKKVGGASQRRTKYGFLHQGSISLQLPPFELLEKVLIESKTILNAMKENSFCLSPENSSLQEKRDQLKSLLKIHLPAYKKIL